MKPVGPHGLQGRTRRSTIPAVVGAARLRGAAVAALVMAAGACASRAPAARIEPGVEQRAIGATRPETHRLLVFAWSLREGQSRFSGAGAARVAVDYRARLDLFGPQDVPYLSAILRQDRLTLPAGVPARLVPPAPLLWSAFGVIQPPAGATLTNAVEEGAETTLDYSARDGRWTFRLRDGLLVGAEWRASGGARHSVELSGVASGAAPGRAVYRDWQEYRELVLELEEQEELEGFPPETWILEAR